jgi:hypothetical protein
MAGRPKGSRDSVSRKDNVLKRIARKILETKIGDISWKSDPGVTNEEWHWRTLLEPVYDAEGRESAKSKEGRLRALAALSDRVRGKPSEFIQHSGTIKGGGTKVLVLPEKRSSAEWAKKYARKEDEKDQPN